ncbi:MAG: hypothetical protein Rhims3KO_10640 [Hyphomicrobiales bacterium]
MKTFSVFEPPILPGSPVEDAESLVFVRHGWSLAALLIPMVWMLARRLWWVLLAYLVLAIAIQAASFAISPVITAGLSVALALIVMIEAGQLRLESMRAKGYREVAVIDAKNLAEAEHLYFTHWLAPQPHRSTASSGGTIRRPSSATPPALPGLPS